MINHWPRSRVFLKPGFSACVYGAALFHGPKKIYRYSAVEHATKVITKAPAFWVAEPC